MLLWSSPLLLLRQPIAHIMLLPAMKLPPSSYSPMQFSWTHYIRQVYIQSRSFYSNRRTLVYQTTSTAASSSSSFDPQPNSTISMSGQGRELENFHKSESLAHRALSSSIPTSRGLRFSAPGPSPSNGPVQPLIGSCPQLPSSGSIQSSSSKLSRVLLNALPASQLLNRAVSRSWIERAENGIERAIFDFRFLSLLAVAGSLAGSFLCFLKGCVFIVESYGAFYNMCMRSEHTGKMVLRLVEAVDVYLTGTVMLIFGMGLYGLFISNVSTNVPPKEDRALQNSSLFGMFLLKERPKWMRIASLDELKTKLGHVVVMILLVKMFERSKAVTIATGLDLLSYSISIFLTSAALLVLRHLHH